MAKNLPGVPPEERPLTSAERQEALRSPRTRQRAAVVLKMRGASYAEIARLLEFRSVRACRQVIDQGLAEGYEASDLNSARNLQRARYEEQLRRANRKATTELIEVEEVVGRGENAHVVTVKVPNPEQRQWAVLESDLTARLSLLDGLNAPSQVVLHVPDAAEFDQVVKSVVVRELGADTDEVDPADFDYEDAEVVE
jgi:hypothetical protein